ncbi:uncharacterized [Tachysurus ichikawai]
MKQSINSAAPPLAGTNLCVIIAAVQLYLKDLVKKKSEPDRQEQRTKALRHKSCVVKAPCCSRRPAIASLWLAKTANQLAKYPQKPE